MAAPPSPIPNIWPRRHEASAILKQCISAHINLFATSRVDSNTISPFSTRGTAEKILVLRLLAVGMENDDNNSVLSLFLTTILDIVADSTGSDADILSQYLQDWIDHLDGEISLSFLNSTFMLVHAPVHPVGRNKRDLRVGERSSKSAIDRFYLCLDHKVLDIHLNDILSCFWSDKLDTDCAICHLPFGGDSGPPIRTFSRCTMEHHVSGIPCHTRMYNRHFECLKRAAIPFIAVSHVWHASIAAAQASRECTIEAGSAVTFTLQKLVEVAIDFYENDGTSEF